MKREVFNLKQSIADAFPDLVNTPGTSQHDWWWRLSRLEAKLSEPIQPDQISELFNRYNNGFINAHDFIITVHEHNKSAHMLYKIDMVVHSNFAWFMFCNQIVTIKFI